MREEGRVKGLLILTIVFISNPCLSGALTTFGKVNSPTTSSASPTPVGKAKECKLESECAGIQNTTCMSDPRDGRTRCLCGDYSAPQNGACTNKFKAIRALCNEDLECTDGAHCVQGNTTLLGRRCYCKEGYIEDNLMCSGSSPVLAISTTLLLGVTLFSGKFNYL
ncbi:uncharacterized protein sosie [Prorops nasuta]|uniref:uncharacterized protein sosie n=1 Tax=Prorops nasuta TaxID=863751 RepID=UPI0034CE8AD1